jgi:hypothetical protein
LAIVEQNMPREDASSNPYAPPGTIVADLPEAVVSARPGSVDWALRLLWVAFALAGVFMLFKPLTLASATAAILVRIIALLFVTPFVWLTWKIAAGRNWARVTWIVITVMGTLVVLSAPRKVIQLSLPGKVNFMLQTGLQWTTVALLLSPSARRWFKSSIPPT